MGLDVRLIDKHEFIDSLLYCMNLDEDTIPAVIKMYEDKDYDSIVALLQLSLPGPPLVPFSRYVNPKYRRFDHFLQAFDELSSQLDVDMVHSLCEKYSHIYNLTDLDTRIASYTGVHNIRAIFDGFVAYSGRRRLKRQKVISILHNYSSALYPFSRIPSIVSHSDCDGYYLPTAKSISDSYYGSSYALALELDTIYSTGAIEALSEIIQDKPKLPSDETYHTAALVYNAWVNLMHCALKSLKDGLIVEFC